MALVSSLFGFCFCFFSCLRHNVTRGFQKTRPSGPGRASSSLLCTLLQMQIIRCICFIVKQNACKVSVLRKGRDNCHTVAAHNTFTQTVHSRVFCPCYAIMAVLIWVGAENLKTECDLATHFCFSTRHFKNQH